MAPARASSCSLYDVRRQPSFFGGDHVQCISFRKSAEGSAWFARYHKTQEWTSQHCVTYAVITAQTSVGIAFSLRPNSARGKTKTKGYERGAAQVVQVVSKMLKRQLGSLVACAMKGNRIRLQILVLAIRVCPTHRWCLGTETCIAIPRLRHKVACVLCGVIRDHRSSWRGTLK